MKTIKTLVILSPAFPENEAATYWVPSQQLMVKALKKNFPGLHIIVLALLYPYSESTYTWNGVEVISLDGMHKRKIRRPILWMKAWRVLKKIHQQNSDIGLLSFWCGEAAFIGNRFAKKYSLQHQIWICGQDARKTNKWVRFIRPKEIQLMAMSLSLSNEFFKNHGIKPFQIVPNAIDPGMFPREKSTTKDIDILGVGSFEPLKQYDVFTRIISELKTKIPAIKAFHAGIGKEQKKIESLIAKLSLQNNLTLLGGKTHQEIIELMLRTKVFMHTSNYEGFSTVCLEAIYAGAHVISFCYPLKQPVPQWHVVSSEKEMYLKALEILTRETTEYTSVLLYSMDNSAEALMRTFIDETFISNNIIDDKTNALQAI
ncbi:MAG: glycosyltransferase [Chitinophagaceae bacterium]